VGGQPVWEPAEQRKLYRRPDSERTHAARPPHKAQCFISDPSFPAATSAERNRLTGRFIPGDLSVGRGGKVERPSPNRIANDALDHRTDQGRGGEVERPSPNQGCFFRRQVGDSFFGGQNVTPRGSDAVRRPSPNRGRDCLPPTSNLRSLGLLVSGGGNSLGFFPRVLREGCLRGMV